MTAHTCKETTTGTRTRRSRGTTTPERGSEGYRQTQVHNSVREEGEVGCTTETGKRKWGMEENTKRTEKKTRNTRGGRERERVPEGGGQEGGRASDAVQERREGRHAQRGQLQKGDRRTHGTCRVSQPQLCRVEMGSLRFGVRSRAGVEPCAARSCSAEVKRRRAGGLPRGWGIGDGEGVGGRRKEGAKETWCRRVVIERHKHKHTTQKRKNK